MTQEEIDKMYMRRCLQLAANGLGRVRPNPMVGCVVVSQVENGEWRVESEGYHQEYGHNHAERNALSRPHPQPLSSEERGVNTPADAICLHPSPLRRGDGGEATLYVNLEPCSHYGLTPPCADLIIEKEIKRVVCCNDDPNPLVAGGGFRKLEAAGIEVVRHALEEEGRELNRRFFTYMEKQRPYVILKWAESKDGFMAPSADAPYWLSTQAQNRLNHRWRTEEAAILVGSETFLQDSPTLTPRHYLGPAPQPVVLDRRGRLFSQSEAKEDKRRSDNSFHSDCDKITISDREWLILRSQSIPEVLHELYEHKLQSVIVEGGRKVLDAFIASGLYDEVRILRSPQTLGSGLKAPEIPPIAPNRLIIVDP